MANSVFSSYRLLLKHFGIEIAASWRTEVLSSIGITAIVFFLSWLIGDKGAFVAFVIAMIANGLWLSMFGIAHLGRIPHLLLTDRDFAEKVKGRPWKFAVIGVVAAAAMMLGLLAGMTWFYFRLQPKVVVGIGPDGRDIRIANLEIENKALRSRVPDERSLKVRSLEGAHEFEEFWHKQPKEPVCNQAGLTPAQQQEAIKPCVEFFNKRTTLYQKVLAPKIMGIVAEFEQKGADVINIKNCAAIAYCGISVVVQLKALSAQLDAHDCLKGLSCCSS
ncbi:MAG: hypothetical protein WB799_14390 [Candidatus Sulfotelmatobacter sp.]